MIRGPSTNGRNSERRRVQAAALQGWKTRHISAILTFYITKLINSMKIQLSNHCNVILIESSLLPMLHLLYPHLFPYDEAASQETLHYSGD